MKLATKIVPVLIVLLGTVACTSSSEQDTSNASNDNTSSSSTREDQANVDVDVELDTAKPQYGSTYESNCYCMLCSKYCTVNGFTYKSGTCCQ